jgi:hypothetical protein
MALTLSKAASAATDVPRPIKKAPGESIGTPA